jgi:hypothetical protein
MKSSYEVTSIICFNCGSDIIVSYFELISLSKIKCSRCHSCYEINNSLAYELRGKLVDLDSAKFEVERALSDLLAGSKKIH